MNFFHARIDRKTFAFGIATALFMTGLIAFMLLLPIAAAGLVIPFISSSVIIERTILLVPAFFLSVATLSLLVRRAHDLGSDGAIWFVGLVLATIFRVLSDNPLINLLPILVIVLLCSLPGQKTENRYGKKPPKKFRFGSIYSH